jgi:hypothetical protein
MKRHNAGFITGAALALLSQTTAVLAEDHEWTFSGKITSTEPGLDFLQVGAAYSISFRADYGLFSSIAAGQYPGALRGEAFKSGVYGYGGGIDGGFVVANDVSMNVGSSLDALILSPRRQNLGQVDLTGAEEGLSLFAHTSGATGGPFPGTSAMDRLNLNHFDQRLFRTVFGTPEGLRWLEGSIDQFRIDGALISQVPEATTWTLILLTLAVAAACRRKFQPSEQRAVARRRNQRTPSSFQPYNAD